VIVGFGATRSPDNGPYPIEATGVKNYGVLPQLRVCTRPPPTGACQPTGPDPYCVRGREIVLLDQRGTVDSCNGDSGGPVFIREASPGTGFRLMGITSRSASRQVTCGAGGVYTLVPTNNDRVYNWLTGLNLNVVR
jgi:hypothetical protein